MSTLTTRRSNASTPHAPEAGDRMDQRTFHAWYDQQPEDLKAELVEGIVYMAAAMKRPHGEHHALLMTWLGTYWTTTPGTFLLDNTTSILGDESEPQPDAALLIEGGQTHEEDDYIVGPPEFVAEVAASSRSFDLHAKKRDYERHGVQEYLVIVVHDQRAVWFVRENDKFVELVPDTEGLLRSRLFPGLWLDPAAFFDINGPRVVQILQQGLATPEHATFVASLARS